MSTNTYVALATQTLGSAAASVTFTGISQAYTDLQIVIAANNTTNGSNCKIQFNGDTGSNYSTTWLEGNGSSASSGRESNATSSFIYYNGNASTYNWSTANVSVQNYSNATTYKTAISRFGNQAQTGAYVDLWRSTSAITSITLNALTQNFQAGSTFTLYGIAAAGAPTAKATGGTITYDVGYTYHTFTGNGTFTPLQSLNADVLMIGGGGGAGGDFGGGGGAGGLLYTAGASLIATGYAVAVGAGGIGTTTTQAGNGSNSEFITYSAIGGGSAGSYSGTFAARTGGSGGGGSRGNSGAAGTSGQGFAGGNSVNDTQGAGGGGAGGAAPNSTTNSQGSAGGIGSNAYSSWASITSTGASGYYAGGGGGSGYYGVTGNGAAGGAGGGGTGGGQNTSGPGGNGTANTGGGGGGGSYASGTTYTGGNGGSGLVIIRYAN